MADQARCPSCGRELPAESPPGSAATGVLDNGQKIASAGLSDGVDSESTAEASAHHSTDSQRITEGPGSHIGPYRLLQEIGEGGMGVVYMAEQEKPVRRRVALKIIKPGMDTGQVIARFEAERQALAHMDHPTHRQGARRRRHRHRAACTS